MVEKEVQARAEDEKIRDNIMMRFSCINAQRDHENHEPKDYFRLERSGYTRMYNRRGGLSRAFLSSSLHVRRIAYHERYLDTCVWATSSEARD